MQHGHFRSHLLLEVTQPGGAGAGPARGGGGEGQVPVMVPNPLSEPGSRAGLWSCKARPPREASAGPQQAPRPQGP